MSGIRRWYFYVVAAVSLQAVVWAVIALLRNLLAPTLGLEDPNLSSAVERIAFQISVIIIGLPMYLLHWRWAQRLPPQESSANQALPERAIYFYIMLGAFLIPLLVNANSFLESLLRLLSDTPNPNRFIDNMLPDQANLANTGIAVIILALMIFYHARLLQEDRRTQNPTLASEILHTLFIYLFSAFGLLTTTVAAANLLRFLLLAGAGQAELSLSRQIISGMAALLTGLPLWIFFWTHAQRLYRKGSYVEMHGLLRKFYLYLVIFMSVLATVSAATALLAGLIRRLLGLDPQSGSGAVLSTLLIGGTVWVYHALVLHEDTRELPLQEEQAGLRRLYWYLVAGVGLLALLVGLGGILGVLFDPGDYIISQQREQLAWFSAMLLAGTIVWALPWRLIQQETAEPDPQGALARSSMARRFYLFFFLLLATLTFLIAAIYILSRLLTAVLGEPIQPGDLRTMGLAAAYAIMAALIWLYHGRLLRQDQQHLESQQAQSAAAARLVVVDDGDGRLGCQLLENLRRTFPGSEISAVGLTASAAQAMDASLDTAEAEQAVAAADIIVGPWSMAAPRTALTGSSISTAIAASSAQKLILPRPTPGWQWVQAEPWNATTAVQEATDAVETIFAGEGIRPRRLNTAAMIILLAIATFVVLWLLAVLLGSVIPIF